MMNNPDEPQFDQKDVYQRLNELFERARTADRILSPREAAWLRAAALAVGLCACTGLRRAPLAALRPSDLNSRHQFSDGAVGPALRVSVDRSHSQRWKGLPPELARLMRQVIEDTGLDATSQDLIWARALRPGTAASPEVLQRRMAACMRRTIGLSSHELRRWLSLVAYAIAWEMEARSSESNTFRCTHQPGHWAAALLDRSIPPYQDHGAGLSSNGDWMSRVMTLEVWRRIRAARTTERPGGMV